MGNAPALGAPADARAQTERPMAVKLAGGQRGPLGLRMDIPGKTWPPVNAQGEGAQTRADLRPTST
eukprot:9079817-Lingulodinium_polyedra.AAC.1